MFKKLLLISALIVSPMLAAKGKDDGSQISGQLLSQSENDHLNGRVCG